MRDFTCEQCDSGILRGKFLPRTGGARRTIGLIVMLLAAAGVVYGVFNLFVTRSAVSQENQDLRAEIQSVLGAGGIPDELAARIFDEGDAAGADLEGLTAEQQELFVAQQARYVSASFGRNLYEVMSGSFYLIIAGLSLVAGLTGWMLTRRRAFQCDSCGAVVDIDR